MFHLELLVVGLIWGAMYAMMALGLTLVYGLLRILHVAHAGVFALGAYAGVLTANATGSLWLAVPAAIGVAALVGPLIYRFVYAPMLSRPPYVALIASIGLFIAMEDGFRLLFGPYGLSFDHNPWFVSTYNLAASASIRCKSQWRCRRWCSRPRSRRSSPPPVSGWRGAPPFPIRRWRRASVSTRFGCAT